ncbi:MAG: YidB family protein [Phyllobacterium sp.]|uniref:YidB family protein n=1 Tax=Phyllobacterium sp. TaxID=1871046 RepID=UPI0030F0D353
MASSRMTALLAMLAVAGWQNRDKLGELLGQITGQKAGNSQTVPNPNVSTASGDTGGLGGLLGGLFGSGGTQGVSGGLGDLLESFTGSGNRDVADSWVQTGPNKPVETTQISDALGSDVIDQLANQTGLSRDELLTRLKAVLPTAVDKLTPLGRVPTQEETSQW